MGKQWIYVLHQKEIEEEDERIYVGYTEHLFTRWNKHVTGCGAVNTFGFNDPEIIGLYEVANNLLFERYHNDVVTFHEWGRDIWSLPYKADDWRSERDSVKYELYDCMQIENMITEMTINLNRDNDIDIRGGKYVRTDKNYKTEVTKPLPDYRPICNCGYPAEVFLGKDNNIWFRCPLAINHTGWLDNFGLYIDSPCKFIKKYTGDAHLWRQLGQLKEREKHPKILDVPRLSQKGQDRWQEKPCVVCDSTMYTPVFQKGYRAVCRGCLEHRFDEIKPPPPDPFGFISDDEED